MKHEMNCMRPHVAHDQAAPVAPTRKALRAATDALIHDALLQADLPALVTLSCDVMREVAAGLLRHGHEPGVGDLVEGAQAMIENGRAVMDKGLMLQSAETINCGAVMIELAVRGLCAALGAPYDAALAEVVRARAAGEAPDVLGLLVGAGLVAAAPDCVLTQ